MTREEVKALLPVIQAWSEGKSIETRYKDSEEAQWVKVDKDAFSDTENYDYRIKPEPMYRPFKDADECWQEMRKHQPFGWVIDPNMQYRQIVKLNRDTFYLDNASARFKFCDILRNWTFADGNPFGIKEEQ